MDQIKIGKFISKRRKYKRLTQQDLAEKLSITDRAVSKWENGICLPDSGIMSELCEILDITINDLFSGEVVNMKNNEKQMKENMLELVKMKEQSDKRLLHLEIVMMIVCLIPLFTSIIISNYIDAKEWAKLVITLSSFLPLLIATPFAILIEQKAGYYECDKCHYRYIPTYFQVFIALHINRTRYLKCPKCNKRSWNKKVISREAE